MRRLIRSPRWRRGNADASALTSLPVSIAPMWRCGPLETDAAQHYQAVGERLVPERTARASGNAVVLQDPQRLVRIERHIAVVLVAAPPKAGSFAAEHRDRAVEAVWFGPRKA